jgi:hypothetical protein
MGTSGKEQDAGVTLATKAEPEREIGFAHHAEAVWDREGSDEDGVVGRGQFSLYFSFLNFLSSKKNIMIEEINLD